MGINLILMVASLPKYMLLHVTSIKI